MADEKPTLRNQLLLALCTAILTTLFNGLLLEHAKSQLAMALERGKSLDARRTTIETWQLNRIVSVFDAAGNLTVEVGKYDGEIMRRVMEDYGKPSAAETFRGNREHEQAPLIAKFAEVSLSDAAVPPEVRGKLESFYVAVEETPLVISDAYLCAMQLPPPPPYGSQAWATWFRPCHQRAVEKLDVAMAARRAAMKALDDYIAGSLTDEGTTK